MATLRVPLFVFFLQMDAPLKCPFLSHTKHLTLFPGHVLSPAHLGFEHVLHLIRLESSRSKNLPLLGFVGMCPRSSSLIVSSFGHIYLGFFGVSQPCLPAL